MGLNLTKTNDKNVSKMITFMKWWSARGMVESLGLVRIYWLFWESISILRPKSSSTSLFEAFLLELASSSSTLKTASKFTPLTYKKKANNKRKKKGGGGNEAYSKKGKTISCAWSCSRICWHWLKVLQFLLREVFQSLYQNLMSVTEKAIICFTF